MSNIRDFVGIGFGPANLSLAITNQEEGYPLNALYIDSKKSFSWHSGMLLDTSRLQVVFMKDLITIRNPRSHYTFLNYVWEKRRLNEFINLRTFFPSRIEFDDYYRWAASHFDGEVKYESRVRRVLPVEGRSNGRVTSLMLEIESTNSSDVEYVETRNLSVALGGKPRIPERVDTNNAPGIFHSSETLHRLKTDYVDRNKPYRFVVVGSGQTAADIFYYLITAYPKADITLATRGFGVKPQDDTHLVNELFFPQAVDMWYEMEEPLKSRMMKRHKDVTHSAADIDLLEPIYDALYSDQVTGANRLHLRRFMDLKQADWTRNEVHATFKELDTDKQTDISADALILATGYDRTTPLPLLEELSPWLQHASNGYLIDRSYAIETTGEFEPRVYVPGYSEPTHGFTETLLSILPVRSAEILEDAVASSKYMSEADKQKIV